jgi:hypothetical protein
VRRAAARRQDAADDSSPVKGRRLASPATSSRWGRGQAGAIDHEPVVLHVRRRGEGPARPVCAKLSRFSGVARGLRRLARRGRRLGAGRERRQPLDLAPARGESSSRALRGRSGRLHDQRGGDAVRGDRARPRRERDRRGRRPDAQGRRGRDDHHLWRRLGPGRGPARSPPLRRAADPDRREPVHHGLYARGSRQGQGRLRRAFPGPDPGDRSGRGRRPSDLPRRTASSPPPRGSRSASISSGGS